jgi:hypothetical protein
MNMTPNKRIDTDAQTAAFVRCLGAGHARRWAAAMQGTGRRSSRLRENPVCPHHFIRMPETS